MGVRCSHSVRRLGERDEAGLARRIGRVGGVRGCFVEEPLGPEGAIDLVGRNVEETEGLLFRLVKLCKEMAGNLEELEGTNDIGADELPRAVDRAIDMAFGGKIHHRRRLGLLKELADIVAFSNISLDKTVTGALSNIGQALETTSIGQLIENNDLRLGMVEDVANEVGTDEAGPSGDDHALHVGLGSWADEWSDEAVRRVYPSPLEIQLGLKVSKILAHGLG